MGYLGFRISWRYYIKEFGNHRPNCGDFKGQVSPDRLEILLRPHFTLLYTICARKKTGDLGPRYGMEGLRFPGGRSYGRKPVSRSVMNDSAPDMRAGDQ